MKARIKKIKEEIKRCEKEISEIKLTKSKALNVDIIKTLKSMSYESIKAILMQKEM